MRGLKPIYISSLRIYGKVYFSSYIFGIVHNSLYIFKINQFFSSIMFEKWTNTFNLLFSQLNLMKFFKEIISCTLQRRKKKLKIALLFSYIAFVIFVILLDLTKKLTDLRYLLISQTLRGNWLISKIMVEIIKYPKYRGQKMFFPPLFICYFDFRILYILITFKWLFITLTIHIYLYLYISKTWSVTFFIVMLMLRHLIRHILAI